MLIVEKKGNDKIESMLKKIKKKWRDTKLTVTLRDNNQYTKKSVKNRKTKMKAEYIQKKFG